MLSGKKCKARVKRHAHPKMLFLNMHKPGTPISTSDRNKVVMMPRSAHEVFIYWQFDPNVTAEMMKKGRKIEGSLEIYYTPTPGGTTYNLRPIPVKFSIYSDKETSHYLKDLSSYVEYQAVLKVPEFHLALQSNTVVTPKDFPDPE